MPAVPAGWTLGIGDRDGTYVARSQLHEEMTGRPGLPEYLAKVVGRSGTFTSSNFQGVTLLAGYYRSEFSDWFYAANVPLSVVQAPLWSSLAAIGAIGLVALLVSTALAYVVGKGFARAAGDLAARAEALGQGRTVAPMSTRVPGVRNDCRRNAGRRTRAGRTRTRVGDGAGDRPRGGLVHL